MKLDWLTRCESTNAEAWRRADEPGFVGIGADEQTAGRGRAGRAWRSPFKLGLYCSALLRPQFPPSLGAAVPLMAAVAAAEACQELGVEVQLKWPNDLLLNGRKLGGILSEAQLDGAGWRVVVGLGLNLKTPAEGYPPEIPGVALDMGLNTPPDAPDLAGLWLPGLLRWSDRVAVEGLAPVIKAWSTWGPPRGSLLSRGDQRGRFEGLSSSGGLLLRVDGVTHEIHAGDVEIITWGASAETLSSRE